MRYKVNDLEVGGVNILEKLKTIMAAFTSQQRQIDQLKQDIENLKRSSNLRQ